MEFSTSGGGRQFSDRFLPARKPKEDKTHPIRRALASRERKRQQRDGTRDQRAADPIDLEVVILGSILGHDPEREQADQGADAGRDPKDAAPGIGRKLGQAACG